MSQPHSISEPVHIPESLRKIIEPILTYIAGESFEDLCKHCVEEQWTLDQAYGHVAFKALILEWYLAPSNHPNAQRYALAELKASANEDDYEQFHPSLKIHQGEDSDPPYSEDSQADNNPYSPCDPRD